MVVAGTLDARAGRPRSRSPGASRTRRRRPARRSNAPGEIVRESALSSGCRWRAPGSRSSPSAARRGPRCAAPFVALAVSLLAVDLFRASMGFNPAIPTTPPTSPRPAPSRYLQRQARSLRRASAPRAQPLPPDIAMRYGLYDARGYDYPVEQRYDQLWRRRRAAAWRTSPRRRAGHRPRRRALRALSLLERHATSAGPRGDPPPRLPAWGSPTRAGTRASTATPARCRARSSSAPARGRRRGRGAARRSTAPGFDAHAAVVTERPIPGIPDAGAARAGARPRAHRALRARARRGRQRHPGAACSCSPTLLPRLEGDGRRAATRRSSASTTSSAASRWARAPTGSSSRYEPRASGSAGSSACWRRWRCWPWWSPSCCGDAGRGRPRA